MGETYPQPFGKYLLLERINAGGMAEVFKAKTFGVEGFERLVAIKRVLPHLVEDESFINMLADEAHIVVQLSNAYIVQVYELGAIDGQHYIAMEYVAGVDLKRMLRRLAEQGIQLPLSQVVYVGSCVSNALDYAHRKCDTEGVPLSIVHRDVSPHNILVSYDGAVKVTDFGIAKAEHRVTKTQGNELKGKFAYMSPEQSRGRGLDHRSDIFSTGSTLWEMLTGEPAFSGENNLEVLERVRRGEVVAPSSVRSDVPPELDRIVLKALAVECDERYQSTGDLADDLEQFSLTLDERPTANLMARFMAAHFADELENEKVSLREFLGTGPGSSASEPAASPPEDVRPTVVEKTVITASSWHSVEGPRRFFDPQTVTMAASPGVTQQGSVPPATVQVVDNTRSSSLPIILAFVLLLVTVPLVVIVLRLLARPTTQVAPVLSASSQPANTVTPVSPVDTAGTVEPAGESGSSSDSGVPPEPTPEDAQRKSPAVRADTRATYLACRAEVSQGMGSSGIVAGDLPKLDAHRAKMKLHAGRSRYADAWAACRRAQAVLSRAEIDKDFVLRKLARFNQAFDRNKHAVKGDQVTSLAEAIAGAMNAGDFRTANRLLNRGLAVTRQKSPQ